MGAEYYQQTAAVRAPGRRQLSRPPGRAPDRPPPARGRTCRHRRRPRSAPGWRAGYPALLLRQGEALAIDPPGDPPALEQREGEGLLDQGVRGRVVGELDQELALVTFDLAG